ncbi:RNA polymerase sigma factor (plasmid) [Tundrisphaera lichenicola]|uniref:RNA polymerase sigma factor n=1 Tax=Tundrisphaera lichenicola TaxID=2029860 RepID=UPI003EBEE70B
MADVNEPSTHRSQLEAVHDPANAPAWGEFISRYEPFIRDLIRKYRLPPGEVDELSQEVLLRLFKKLPCGKFDLHRRFRPWLTTVVKHAYVDHQRAKKRTEGIASGGTSAQRRIQEIPDHGVVPPAEESLDREGLLRIACQHVQSQVSEKQWRAFVGTTILDRSGHEIADELGMNVGAVHTAKCRVMRRIHDEVARLIGSS